MRPLYARRFALRVPKVRRLGARWASATLGRCRRAAQAPDGDPQHLCYSAGSSEPERANKRADNYGGGFIRAGAAAVFAETLAVEEGVGEVEEVGPLGVEAERADEVQRECRGEGGTRQNDRDPPAAGRFRHNAETTPGVRVAPGPGMTDQPWFHPRIAIRINGFAVGPR
jgi:hypothetical protein